MSALLVWRWVGADLESALGVCFFRPPTRTGRLLRTQRICRHQHGSHHARRRPRCFEQLVAHRHRGLFGTLAKDGPGTTTGTTYQGNAFALLAGSELGSAMNALGLLGSGTTLSLADLAGLTLNPGVYTVPAGTSNLTGTLTLDGLGDINARPCRLLCPSTRASTRRAALSTRLQRRAQAGKIDTAPNITRHPSDIP